MAYRNIYRLTRAKWTDGLLAIVTLGQLGQASFAVPDRPTAEAAIANDAAKIEVDLSYAIRKYNLKLGSPRQEITVH